MKKTCFSQYIDDINGIIKEARLKHDKTPIELERVTKGTKKGSTLIGGAFFMIRTEVGSII